MEDRLTLSYFYGKEADQYSFYKIPKLLFTDEHFKKVSVEAKGNQKCNDKGGSYQLRFFRGCDGRSGPG